MLRDPTPVDRRRRHERPPFGRKGDQRMLGCDTGEGPANAGMTAAKAHPYMVSYMRLGPVEQDRASGRYELGPLALQMGLASMRRLNPVRIATEAIAELVLRINHAVALSVWGNH